MKIYYVADHIEFIDMNQKLFLCNNSIQSDILQITLL